jgi:uncharacterized protein
MQNYHEPPSELSAQTRDFTRALTTLKEEIEPIDWYEQRVDVTQDQHLKKILKHNQLEEMEHACMTLEWLRRNMKGWDKQMKQYLFTEKDVTKIEDK